MKLNYFASATALLGYVSGVPTQQRLPSNGTIIVPNALGINRTYTVTDQTWFLEAPPHVPKHNFTGTVQQVYAHISANYPAYEWPGLNDDSTAEVGDPDAGTVECWRWAACTFGAALSGIQYLKGVPGQPGNLANSCGRVSCGNDCGIFWCNDNNYGLQLPSFKWIGDYANQIQNTCDYMGGSDTMTFGQCFHPTEGWNVILAKPAQYC